MISVIVLTYNSRQHLRTLFESLARQTYQPLELIVIDNASTDGTVQWLEQQTICRIDRLIRNTENVWYAKANNQAAAHARGEYILFCNDDLMLDADCIRQLVAVARLHPKTGLIGAKLLKLTATGRTSIVDSAGLVITRWRQVMNRGENQPDAGQWNTVQSVFGITGALVMAARSALHAVSPNGEYFDEQFVAYKEDVDLSWRMIRAGYTNWYVPSAVAYHARSIQRGKLIQRRTQSKFIRAMSYRNHWWAIIKNDAAKEFWRDAWVILPYELFKLLYIVLAEWGTARRLPELLRGIKAVKRKRIPAAAAYSLRSWIQ